MNTFSTQLNALLILILSGIIISAFGVQIFLEEQPCPLCFLQRLGMTGVAIGAIMNLRFGIKTKHYAVSLLSCVFGGVVALRQTALHICPGDPSFGEPILGLDLWVWSFLVFVCSITYIAFLLFLYDPEYATQKTQKMNWFGKLAIWIFVLVTIGNILSVLHSCGLGPCSEF
ncbi:MAG: Disulfide bond formation protein B [Chlamydiae bacterium]|nr:Disulfide bond formation protein B [Chlamydiota bacterium]